MNSVFKEEILADKLSKLNRTQQCIETLSHWCIFHRSKAEQVVATWKKQFDKSEMLHRISLLFLANDIMQNSKRKGNEFVVEFWKIIPSAIKDVVAKNDDQGNAAVARLIRVWEERKVFGSQMPNLKDLMLGEDAPPSLEFSKKRSRSSVTITKRDSRSIKSKLSIGGTPEKIVSAFHLVLSEQSNEDAEMSKCKSAVQRVRKIEKDVDIACTIAKDPKRKTLMKELEEQQNLLKHCIEKLKLVEASRVALVSQLKEALHEQESELENVRTQMQVAQAQVQEASNMQRRLDNEDYSQYATSKSEAATKKSAAAIAAEVADKLTASSSSQLIMSSVLSTFAAEEAKNACLTSESTTSKPNISMPNSDTHVYMSAQQLTAVPNHSYPSVLVTQPTLHNVTQPSLHNVTQPSLHNVTQPIIHNVTQPILHNVAPTLQGQYHLHSNPSPQQYVQSTGGVISPYGYGSIPPLQPAPPPPPFNNQPLQIAQQQPLPITQQAPAPPSFRPLQPSGMMYYVNH